MEVENFKHLRPTSLALVRLVSRDQLPRFPGDIFVSDAELRTDASTIFHQFDTTEEEGFRAARLYLHDTLFDWTGGDDHDFIGVHKVIRLRDSETTNGRFSDQSGTFTSDSGNEGNDYIDISTALLSNIAEAEATISSGPTGIGVVDTEQQGGPLDPTLRVNLSGNIPSGETVTVDWAARVTPLADYARTGVFISRLLNDRTISTTEEIDLRGVGASHEDRTAVEYTAASSDPAIVEANILPHVTGYDGEDQSQTISWSYDTRLEIVPQSPGTATITVTAYIDDVGTAQTTFEVTVE